MATSLPGIPEPTVEPVQSLLTIQALKEITEIRNGIRGDLLDKAVTFRDLVALGLITEEQANAQAR